MKRFRNTLVLSLMALATASSLLDTAYAQGPSPSLLPQGESAVKRRRLSMDRASQACSPSISGRFSNPETGQLERFVSSRRPISHVIVVETSKRFPAPPHARPAHPRRPVSSSTEARRRITRAIKTGPKPSITRYPEKPLLQTDLAVTQCAVACVDYTDGSLNYVVFGKIKNVGQFSYNGGRDYKVSPLTTTSFNVVESAAIPPLAPGQTFSFQTWLPKNMVPDGVFVVINPHSDANPSNDKGHWGALP